MLFFCNRLQLVPQCHCIKILINFQLKTGNQEMRSESSPQPAEATTARPTNHNPLFAIGPVSPLNHRSLQRHQTNQNPEYAGIFTDVTRVFFFSVSAGNLFFHNHTHTPSHTYGRLGSYNLIPQKLQ